MMIWEISTLIISIAFLILVSFLIPTIIQIRQSARRLENISEKIDQHLPDILANLKEISINLSAILITGRHHAESIGGAVEQIKGIVNDVADFEKKFKKRAESPLFRTIKVVSALAKAMNVFFLVFSRRKKSKR